MVIAYLQFLFITGSFSKIHIMLDEARLRHILKQGSQVLVSTFSC